MSEQKTEKLKTEDLILDLVKEEHQQVALNFIEYLKSNKLTFSNNKIRYKSKRVGSFGIDKYNDWNIQIFTQYDEHFNDLISKEPEIIKDFVKGQINYNGCGRCISGKCAGTGISMKNPDELFLDFSKRLIVLRCDAILNERVPKCNYIKISDRGTIKKCAKCKVCNPACRKLKNF